MKGTFDEDGRFIPEGYDSTADYVTEHLNWIKQHPNFRNSEYHEYNKTYWEVMYLVYYPGTVWRNLLAFRFRYVDEQSLKKQNEVSDMFSRLIAEESTITDNSNWAFVTVGFNEQTITVPQMLAVSANISKFKHFISGKYVLEKFRTNGIHHHTHFLVDLACKYTPSKLAQDLFKIKGLSKICMGATFIDVKMLTNKRNKAQPRSVYENYVEGIKQESKMNCVYKDREWRKQNNIQDIYVF